MFYIFLVKWHVLFILYTTHQFALGEGWGLEVEASHDAIGGHAFVVLHEVDFSHLLLELSL